ncbi:MAG: DUF2071 domain-containing protein [Verrucomicrobiota bacterium]
MPKFLTAEWRHLLFLNYEVEPSVLTPYLPAGTALDFFQDRTFASLVGFRFLKTRLKGFPIPFHQHFDEVNLRFYVKRQGPDGEWRRGVVFIKEIVPKPAITWVARACYGEKYVTTRMRHQLRLDEPDPSARYQWKHGGAWQTLGLTLDGPAEDLQPGSEEEFITEHYWGYSHTRGGNTVEYQVAHPRWRVRPASQPIAEIDLVSLYGQAFAEPLSQAPTSVLYAEGSPVAVYDGQKIA